jgi:hypothetical protein
MSHRQRHRTAAFSRRLQRVVDGVPADPTNRQRKPRAHYNCPRCPGEFRRVWQVRLHLNLAACAVA